MISKVWKVLLIRQKDYLAPLEECRKSGLVRDDSDIEWKNVKDELYLIKQKFG